jgi:hypothetical protein
VIPALGTIRHTHRRRTLVTIESNDAAPESTRPVIDRSDVPLGQSHPPLVSGADTVVVPRADTVVVRADTVGSLLRDDAVVRAARRSSPADSALLNDAVRDAIRLQEEAGLDVITDGEVRRVSWAQTPRAASAPPTQAAARPVIPPWSAVSRPRRGSGT